LARQLPWLGMHPRFGARGRAGEGACHDPSLARRAGFHLARSACGFSPRRGPVSPAAIFHVMKLRGLYAMTPDGPGVLEKVEEALEGGIALLQYRRKERGSIDEATALLALSRRFGVPFIVNDDVGLALAIGAD